VVAVRIDQPDDGGDVPADADVPVPAALDAGEPPGPGQPDRVPDAARPPDAGERTERVLEHRAKVDEAYRAHAIDQGCARVEKIERETVTPAMRRIEAEDPERHLAGLEHRLKGKERLAEKVRDAMTERGRTVGQAFASVKDAIRYTFCYADEQYVSGLERDCARIKSAGFEPVERRNSWANEEYKGINSRWRVPDTGQLFEIQFHTRASFEAKEETHWAYEKLRDPATSKAEQEAMSAYQRKITARVPIPPGAAEVPDYRYP
jgi:hypothetical protein